MHIVRLVSIIKPPLSDLGISHFCNLTFCETVCDMIVVAIIGDSDQVGSRRSISPVNESP